MRASSRPTTPSTVAVRDRLAKVRTVDPDEGMAARLREIRADMRSRLPAEFLEDDATDALYGPNGLPR